MSDDRPGFYSMSYVSPMDSITVRQTARMTDKAKAIEDAIALLQREGFEVIPPKKPRTSMSADIAATIEGRYIPEQPGS